MDVRITGSASRAGRDPSRATRKPRPSTKTSGRSPPCFGTDQPSNSARDSSEPGGLQFDVRCVEKKARALSASVVLRGLGANMTEPLGRRRRMCAEALVSGIWHSGSAHASHA